MQLDALHFVQFSFACYKGQSLTSISKGMQVCVYRKWTVISLVAMEIITCDTGGRSYLKVSEPSDVTGGNHQ